MAYTNVHRGARISPSKARLVTDMISGKSVDEALSMLATSKKRAAVFVKNALNAAIANADQAEVNIRNLQVTEARVDEGPTMKRFQPKDRGRAHPIMKRSSHITVAVSEA
ncbi:50S ribosomal protein L22 [Poriferisphaera corsica]|uniref:Large ribosomal subunit protein uL22 n=1 Tax=Poriferisphaera corsica TaxID=2528020 RepID=A0A517YT25_9BACT|nr:50S ribosomal protein L22 [Poriferisphaera corsica]QDU33371.1 50S ribosomal protein L22 [Poriferisphaera corsica]